MTASPCATRKRGGGNGDQPAIRARANQLPKTTLSRCLCALLVSTASTPHAYSAFHDLSPSNRSSPRLRPPPTPLLPPLPPLLPRPPPCSPSMPILISRITPVPRGRSSSLLPPLLPSWLANKTRRRSPPPLRMLLPLPPPLRPRPCELSGTGKYRLSLLPSPPPSPPPLPRSLTLTWLMIE